MMKKRGVNAFSVPYRLLFGNELSFLIRVPKMRCEPSKRPHFVDSFTFHRKFK